MKKFLLSLLIVLFFGSYAYAIPVQFDNEGNSSYTSYENFQFIAMNNYFTLEEDTENVDGEPLASAGDILTSDVISVQDQGSGEFTEKFKIDLHRGQDTDSDYISWGNINAELDLQGQYTDDDNINFTGGSARMIDTDTSENIATLNLASALTSNLGGSLVGGEQLGMNIDIEFIYDWIDPDYFGPDEQALVDDDNSWLLAFAATRIDQEELHVGSEDYYIEWQLQGGRIEHASEVPEPTTLLLFGTGLLGLAAFGRKKFMNKS